MMAAHGTAELPGLLPTVLGSKSINTQLAYSQDLARFAEFRNAATPEAAVMDLLRRPRGEANRIALAYRNWMRQERSLSAASVNRALAALRSVTSHARTFGQIDWSLEVRGLPIEQRSRDTRGPGRSAVEAMLRAARHVGGPKGARDAAILLLLYACGLRRAEVVTLRVRDVELSDMRMAVACKGRLTRQWMMLPCEVQSALGAWLAVRPNDDDGDGPLMVSLHRGRVGQALSGPGVYWLVRQYGERVGTRATPHGLRHTGTTELVRRGRSLADVAKWTRHANLATLQAYVDDEEGVELTLCSELAQAVQP